MSKNERYHTSIYPKRVGYLLYNTRHNYNYNKNELLREMNNNISNYEKNLFPNIIVLTHQKVDHKLS